MESKIKIQSVHLDFPIYDYQSRSLRNKIKNYGINMRKEALNNKQNKKIVEALKNVSFNFSHGDRVGLLGPNGSGKTTLLKLIAGIYSPTSGIIKKTGDITLQAKFI